MSEEAATHQSGDFFGSIQNAALAWALSYHPRSGATADFPEGSEFGTWIYRHRYEQDSEGRNQYMFGRRPQVFGQVDGDPDNPRTPHRYNERGMDRVIAWIPGEFDNADAVSFIHTHPTNRSAEDYRIGAERFSATDVQGAQEMLRRQQEYHRYHGFDEYERAQRTLLAERIERRNYGAFANMETSMVVTPQGYMRELRPLWDPLVHQPTFRQGTVMNESRYVTEVLPGNSNIFECASNAGNRHWTWRPVQQSSGATRSIMATNSAIANESNPQLREAQGSTAKPARSETTTEGLRGTTTLPRINPASIPEHMLPQML